MTLRYSDYLIKYCQQRSANVELPLVPTSQPVTMKVKTIHGVNSITLLPNVIHQFCVYRLDNNLPLQKQEGTGSS